TTAWWLASVDGWARSNANAFPAIDSFLRMTACMAHLRAVAPRWGRVPIDCVGRVARTPQPLGGTVAMRQQRAKPETSAKVWHLRTPQTARKALPRLDFQEDGTRSDGRRLVVRSGGGFGGGSVLKFGQFIRDSVLKVADLEVEVPNL